MKNVGWGQASTISFKVTGAFEIDLELAAKPFGLAPDVTRDVPLYVVPQRAGSPLPLHLTLAYMDAHGKALPPVERAFDITVRSKDERRGDSTPIIIGDGGKIIHMGSGDYVEDGQVKIERHTLSATPTPAQPTPVSGDTSGQTVETHRITCVNCGTEQPADRFKCVKCGIPFARCATLPARPARANRLLPALRRGAGVKVGTAVLRALPAAPNSQRTGAGVLLMHAACPLYGALVVATISQVQGDSACTVELADKGSPDARQPHTVQGTDSKPDDSEQEIGKASGLSRFTDVRFPGKCRIRESVRLSVQLTARPVPISMEPSVPPPGQHRPMPVNISRRDSLAELVNLLVTVSADGFSIDPPWCMMKVPLSGDSETVNFDLIGHSLGRKVIEVEFFDGTVRVGYGAIETVVVHSDVWRDLSCSL